MTIDGLENVINANEPWQYASKGFVNAKHKDAVTTEYGSWFSSLGAWNWFVTRTLGRPVDMGYTQAGLGTARTCLRDMLVRSDASRAIVVFELQERGVPHLHALLECQRGINARIEERRDFELWGIARWKPYHKDGGAAAYIGKQLGAVGYMAKELVEMYIFDSGPYSERDLSGKKLDRYRC